MTNVVLFSINAEGFRLGRVLFVATNLLRYNFQLPHLTCICFRLMRSVSYRREQELFLDPRTQQNITAKGKKIEPIVTSSVLVMSACHLCNRFFSGTRPTIIVVFAQPCPAEEKPHWFRGAKSCISFKVVRLFVSQQKIVVSEVVNKPICAFRLTIATRVRNM